MGRVCGQLRGRVCQAGATRAHGRPKRSPQTSSAGAIRRPSPPSTTTTSERHLNARLATLILLTSIYYCLLLCVDNEIDKDLVSVWSACCFVSVCTLLSGRKIHVPCNTVQYIAIHRKTGEGTLMQTRMRKRYKPVQSTANHRSRSQIECK